MVGRLQGELKQTKPFASLEVEAFLNLVRTVDLLSRHLSAQLKAHDLSMTQYNVLRILRGAGTKGLPCGEVGARLVTWDPDITRLIDRLERRGLVSRKREEDDRRVVLVRLTASGAAFLARDDLDNQILSAHQDSLGHLSATDLTHLIDMLENIRERLGPKA
jgi:DNA-binding MarR family transcriptional regulator